MSSDATFIDLIAQASLLIDEAAEEYHDMAAGEATYRVVRVRLDELAETARAARDRLDADYGLLRAAPAAFAAATPADFTEDSR